MTGHRLRVGLWVVSGKGDDADYGYLHGTAGADLAVSWFASMTGGTLAANDAEPVTFETMEAAREEFLARFAMGAP